MIEQLKKRIQEKRAVVGVIGMGYVGLPLLLEFSRVGFSTIGFDLDERKIESLSQGKSYIKHIGHEKIETLVGSGLFTATSDFSRLKTCDAILICVPTPLNKNREPDLAYVEATTKAIAQHLKKGQLITLESTTYPGTTDELCQPILENESGLVAGEDFFLAYSPEREDPANPYFTTSSTPKVVGGITKDCTAIATLLYNQIVEQTVPVSSCREAEMTKLLENIFRSVNIALANEIKMVCDRMSINVWEVIEAAATKPFGFMPFYPGPGLGGHCIPIDPFYLTWKAREYKLSTRFIELAGEINSSMPEYVIHKLSLALNTVAKPLKGAKILLLGAAYKKDVDDMRESPALELIDRLLSLGVKVSYNDPHIPVLPSTRKHKFDMKSKPLTEKNLTATDAVLIVTNHTAYDYNFIVKHANLIVDTRNATAAVKRGRKKIFLA